jgi:hypothetical protein
MYEPTASTQPNRDQGGIDFSEFKEKIIINQILGDPQQFHIQASKMLNNNNFFNIFNGKTKDKIVVMRKNDKLYRRKKEKKVKFKLDDIDESEIIEVPSHNPGNDDADDDDDDDDDEKYNKLKIEMPKIMKFQSGVDMAELEKAEIFFETSIKLLQNEKIKKKTILLTEEHNHLN